jgi:hypothetical protein
MSGLALLGLIGLVAIGLVVWVIDALTSAVHSMKAQQVKRRNERRLEDRRRNEEAIRIVRESAPELAALRNAVSILRDFVARANAYRPKFIFPSSMQFREVQFSFPFHFPRYCERSSNGPDPQPWVTTLDNLFVSKGDDLRSIYEICMGKHAFPCSEPQLSFNPPPRPEYPRVELPLSGTKIEADRGFANRLRKLLTLELSQTWKLTKHPTN